MIGRLTVASLKCVRANSAVRVNISKACASSLVAKFDESVHSLPLREAVRYTDKNMKWTARDFLNYTEAHANALLEHGFQPGDAIAIWLPDGAEKHVTLVAAAKAGLKVVDVDINVTDVQDIRSFLKDSNCKAIYFKPEHENHHYLNLLRKAIPELYHYDDSHGQFFHSKFFPSLKFFIHTGFDNELGCLNFKELFLRDPATSYVEQLAPTLNDEAPLYVQIKKGPTGIVTTEAAPHKSALDHPTWAFAKKIVNKQFFETN